MPACLSREQRGLSTMKRIVRRIAIGWCRAAPALTDRGDEIRRLATSVLKRREPRSWQFCHGIVILVRRAHSNSKSATTRINRAAQARATARRDVHRCPARFCDTSRTLRLFLRALSPLVFTEPMAVRHFRQFAWL